MSRPGSTSPEPVSCPIVEDIDIDWYDTGTGKGIALTAVFGAVSIRAIVPGVGDVRYTRYPDGTEEIYKLSNDPYEHVNRLDFRTGKGLTAADNALHNTVRGLMQDRLAEEGILLSDGIAPIQGTTADELIVGTSGSGVNVLRGGGGDDTYVVYKQSTIVEDAGRGFDAIVLQNATLEKTFNLPANVEMIQVSKFFTGNAADNWIFAGGNAGTLNGMGGNDTIRTGAGSFLVDGGEGNDRLLGDNGADTIVGGSGNDTITGEDNADDLSGGKGADVITGDAGNDKLKGNAGADVLTGGTGSDLFIVSTATELGWRHRRPDKGFRGCRRCGRRSHRPGGDRCSRGTGRQSGLQLEQVGSRYAARRRRGRQHGPLRQHRFRRGLRTPHRPRRRPGGSRRLHGGRLRALTVSVGGDRAPNR